MFLCVMYLLNCSVAIYCNDRCPVLYSVGQPFKGDYVEVTKNPKYQKLNSLAEDKVLLADVVSKINRANGKVSTSSPVPIELTL